MSVVVSVTDIVAAMDGQSDDLTNFLDRSTGKIVPITGEDRQRAENEDVDVAGLPASEREGVLKIRAVLDSSNFVPVPDKFEIHEWAIMERFAISQAVRSTRTALIDAIHGLDAFAAFKETVRGLGLEEAWFGFRQTAFEDIAKDWLDENGIPYI
jgi:hypothetical protein